MTNPIVPPPLPFEENAPAASARSPRIWPSVLLLGIFWAVYLVLRWTELGVSLGFTGFVALYGVGALTVLLFAVWWLAASRVGWAERFGLLGIAVFVGIAVAFLADKPTLVLLLMPGLPLVMTAWAIGLFVMRHWRPKPRQWALAGAICLVWAPFLLVRTQGVGGDFQPELAWRWTLTPEQKYLLDLDRTGKPLSGTGSRHGLTLGPDDWPGFRGSNRDGTLRDVRIATNWQISPPKLLWRRRIGPAWSSVAVVGDRLFTQEQRGQQEAVVCLDTAKGRTLWSHLDTARHEDGQGGAGPRATPTFAAGRVFALGATGLLNCLDAETGECLWSRNIAVDAGTNVPVWGFSSSPLVVDQVVVVFAGSESSASEKTLLAYRTDSGQLAWSAAGGKYSYSSPQLVSLGDKSQVLFVSDRGLCAFDPVSGAVLWRHPTSGAQIGIPLSVQPRAVGGNRILFDAGADIGTALIHLNDAAGTWTAEQVWVSRQLKPSFNDFVVHGDAVYGFDGRMFTCLDLHSGKRRWKDGRYGSGQVLLLSAQPLLVVVTETGEVVLVAANPDEHHELARFQALSGKTWNHPVLAHGRLYVRNAEEIACYELRLTGSSDLAGRLSWRTRPLPHPTVSPIR
jgi:outer membrane protein assembly factor BamB